MDFYRGNLPVRKTANLAANLPAGALTWQVLDHPNAWTVADYLAAQQLDATNVSNWIASGAKPSDKPKPTPLPGSAKTKKKKSKGEIKAAATRFKNKAVPILPPAGEPGKEPDNPWQEN